MEASFKPFFIACNANQARLYMLIMAIAVILTSELFQPVSALPVMSPSLLWAAGLENFIADDQAFLQGGTSAEKVRASEFAFKEKREKRSVDELRNERGDELQTAGELIYHTYEELPPELHNWLVEMDMVRSESIENVLEEEEEPVDENNEEMRTRTRKAAAVNFNSVKKYLWPGGRVPYTFHPFVSGPGRQAAMRGLEHWMSHTCLKFVPREDTDHDYIQFVERQGCWSYVGRQGGAQSLSLGPTVNSYCKTTGVVVHEIGHAVGLLHEQSRPDRDEYIEIIWDNILAEGRRSFHKYKWSRVELFSLPYDYTSIMHYPPYAFSKNYKKTIIPLDPQVKMMGQRKSLSPVDIKMANLLYNCSVVNNSNPLENISNASNSIPKNSFLIRNSDTLTCLDVSNKTSSSAQPLRDQHVYTGLYYVALTDCRPDSRDQYWQWTDKDSLLHLGTFLCLTALVSRHNDNDIEESMVPDKLVLMHCRDGDIRQKWSCAGDFIEHTNSGKCITASTTTCPSRRDTERTRNKRHEHLERLADELHQFLNNSNLNVPIEEQMNETLLLENSTHLMANVTYAAKLAFCEQSNTRQLWCSLDDTVQMTNQSESGFGLSNAGRDSICSRNDTSSHNIDPCYVKDMAETSGLSLYLAKWTTCDRIGYYAAGFYHTNQVSGNGATGLLTGMDCCASSSVFTGQPDTPPSTHEEDCVEIEWWNWQDTLISEGWFTCPRGKFLKGFLISTRPFSYGHYIWKVMCCKPRLSPVVYEHCYTDYGHGTDDTGVHRCSLEGYHVTSMYKKDCVGSNDSCVEEELTCCTSI